MTDNHDLAATEIEFGSDYSQQFIVGTLGAIAGGIIVAIAFALVIYFNPPSPTQSQLQSEYYRGVYDSCVFVNYKFFGISGKESEDVCNKFSDTTDKDNWFELESKGWGHQ